MTMPSATLTVHHRQGDVLMPFTSGETLRETLLRNGFRLASVCGGKGVCGQCRVFTEFHSESQASLSEKQINTGWRLACQIEPFANQQVWLEQSPQTQIWRTLRDDEYCLATPLLPCLNGLRYGLAIDLGTTHLRLSLWDKWHAKRLVGLGLLNPQIALGTDVLTRLMEAGNSAIQANELRQLVSMAIADALAQTAKTLNLTLSQVDEVVIVGNTAMLSLLSGKNIDLLLQPEFWTQRIAVQPDDCAVFLAQWGLSNRANLRFIAPLGGFVGSDLLADLRVLRILEQPAGTLLIDFGTNSEIALWDGQTLHITAAAGGPAFEGSGIACGMSGEEGAVYRLSANNAGEPMLAVWGNGQAQGFCGSGLVDLLAWLRRTNRVDKLGRFTAGLKAFEIKGLVIKPADIDVMQRAKAAIAAGVIYLCQQAQIELTALQRVYACGALGRGLDIDNAQAIGLLPVIPATQIYLEGNSALAGCEQILLSGADDDYCASIQAVAKVYNMADETDFECLFVENLYIQPMST